MNSIELSEQLMRNGWWDEAAEALRRPDVHPADRNLQTAALICRRECAAWAAQLASVCTQEQLRREMLSRFDRFTVQWYFDQYVGEGSLQWQRSEKANEKTD